LGLVFKELYKEARDNNRGLWGNDAPSHNKNLSECQKAGGRLTKTRECDGSESVWCFISEKEECYADQVSKGKCTVGEYSEELRGIVGISPRVLCDSEQ